MDINKADIQNPWGEEEKLDLKGIAPVNVEHTEPTPKNKFAPWHKPRKQWLRDNQWGATISALIDKLELSKSGRALNYLSLPGADLLDVRSLENVFTEKKVKLKFLGLNYIDDNDKEQSAEQNLSLNEVRSLDFVEQESLVIPEQFEKISEENSIASDRVLRKHQSFDVINIDLCASFADKKPGGAQGTLYSAIYKLLKHQAFYRTEDWVFFLTSRTDKKKVEFSALKALIDTVLRTVNEEITKIYFEERSQITLTSLNSPELTADSFSTSQHRFCFLSSFGIWKSDALLNGEGKSKSVMKEIFGYHVESTDSVADMVSMAFWCSRLPLADSDKSGLSTATINPQAPAPQVVHLQQAKRAFERSLDCKDLDLYLIENKADYQTALERSRSLLKKARYAIDEYDPWVALQEERIQTLLQAGRPAEG